jgi:hypothetical protein
LIQGFLLEAGLSRGDLTEAEWRVLKGLLPIDPANRGPGRPPLFHPLITAVLQSAVASQFGLWNVASGMVNHLLAM